MSDADFDPFDPKSYEEQSTAVVDGVSESVASEAGRLDGQEEGRIGGNAAGIGHMVIDPITEVPEAVWYVRPVAGGQYGPAKGDVMRAWLSEGRVSPDSLVWREGWSDWQLAGPVFPSLNPTYTAPVTTASLGAASRVGDSSLSSIRSTGKTVEERVPPRESRDGSPRRDAVRELPLARTDATGSLAPNRGATAVRTATKPKSIAVVVVLGVLVVGLVAVLVAVVMSQR